MEIIPSLEKKGKREKMLKRKNIYPNLKCIFFLLELSSKSYATKTISELANGARGDNKKTFEIITFSIKQRKEAAGKKR